MFSYILIFFAIDVKLAMDQQRNLPSLKSLNSWNGGKLIMVKKKVNFHGFKNKFAADLIFFLSQWSSNAISYVKSVAMLKILC